MRPFCLGKPDDPGRTGGDCRLFTEAVLWIARTGRSWGSLTTKILALTDALGNLVRIVLPPGQRYDTIGVALLIEGIEFNGLIADKAFDADWIIAELNQRGAKIVSR